MSGSLCATKRDLSRTEYKSEWAPERVRTFRKILELFPFAYTKAILATVIEAAGKTMKKNVIISESLNQIQSEGTRVASVLLPHTPSHHFVFMYDIQ